MPSLTPAQQERLENIRKFASTVPPDVRALIGRMALASQRVQEHWPYYSRVRFQASIAAGPPVVYTFTLKQQVLGFSDAIGQDMGPAGFPTPTIATIADTNLSESAKTKDGQNLEIFGISCFIVPTSDPTMLAFVYQTASLAFSQSGGDTQKKVGPLLFVPSPGGLSGYAASFGTQANKSQNHTDYGFITNGLPVQGNHWKLPNPVIWQPSGKVDSTLNLVCTLERAITLPSLTPRALGLSTDFQDLFAPPTTPGAAYTYVELMFLLLSRQRSARSKND
jgi:hypothetical protein